MSDDVKTGNGAIERYQPPRLPWHDAVAERFSDMGVNKTTWKVLCEAIFPRAKSPDSIIMALSYCQARKLDPFKRPVNIVPMWDSKANEGEGGYVETVWPSIAELRTTAFRTGQYAGCEETVFGPMVTKTFKGEVWINKKKTPVEKTVTFPEWAQVTVLRVLHGVERRFVGPRVHWQETYATMGSSDVPNEMWAGRAVGQLEKCSEAAALRKAFPEELGNDPTSEEMDGRRVYHDVVRESVPISTPKAVPKLAPPPAPPPPPPPPLQMAVSIGEAQDSGIGTLSHIGDVSFPHPTTVTVSLPSSEHETAMIPVGKKGRKKSAPAAPAAPSVPSTPEKTSAKDPMAGFSDADLDLVTEFVDALNESTDANGVRNVERYFAVRLLQISDSAREFCLNKLQGAKGKLPP
jgi:phage recombination protein Bet